MTLTTSPEYGAYRPAASRGKLSPKDNQPLRARGYILLRTIRVPRPRRAAQ